MREIKLFKTKEDNFTAYVDNIYIHSKYYPFREAEKFVEENKSIYLNKKYIVIYGIAFGYHIMKLLEKCSKDCKVFIFDVDTEIVKESYKYGMLNEIIKDDRVELFIGESRKFYQKLSEKMKLVDDIMIYKPSIKVLPLNYKNVINVFKSYELSKIGLKRFGEMAKENYRCNINIKDTIADFFKNYSFSNKSVVIASAGPSLESSLKTLKKNRNKFYIFAIGQSLRILMNNGIKPDVIVIIDPQDAVYNNQLIGYENLDIPLCFLSTASKLAVTNYKGPKYIFFNSKDKENKDDIIVNTGKTVAVAALDLAIKSGGTRIIFTGQDLAFINNKFHAGDEEDEKHTSISQVEGVNGEILNTTSGMLEFKRNIETIIKTNPQITFINCSKGAKIEGSLEMDIIKCW